MIAKIKHFRGVGLVTKALNKEGPFERAAEEVSLLEAADRARWEERERQWEAKRRCLTVEARNGRT